MAAGTGGCCSTSARRPRQTRCGARESNRHRPCVGRRRLVFARIVTSDAVIDTDANRPSSSSSAGIRHAYEHHQHPPRPSGRRGPLGGPVRRDLARGLSGDHPGRRPGADDLAAQLAMVARRDPAQPAPRGGRDRRAASSATRSTDRRGAASSRPPARSTNSTSARPTRASVSAGACSGPSPTISPTTACPGSGSGRWRGTSGPGPSMRASAASRSATPSTGSRGRFCPRSVSASADLAEARAASCGPVRRGRASGLATGRTDGRDGGGLGQAGHGSQREAAGPPAPGRGLAARAVAVLDPPRGGDPVHPRRHLLDPARPRPLDAASRPRSPEPGRARPEGAPGARGPLDRADLARASPRPGAGASAPPTAPEADPTISCKRRRLPQGTISFAAEGP